MIWERFRDLIAVERLTCGQKYVWLLSDVDRKLPGFHFMEKSPLIFSVPKMKTNWPAWSLPCSVGCLLVLVLLVSCGSLCGQHLGFAHFVHMWFNLWSTTVFSALLTLYSSGLLCGQPSSPAPSTSACDNLNLVSPIQTHVSFQIARGLISVKWLKGIC